MELTGRLSGRNALVTGGGRGIGRAIALALAGEGAAVAVAARSRKEVEAVAVEIEAGAGSRLAAAFAADVTRDDDVAAMAREAAGRLGGVDILVNCAGDAASAPLHRTDRALWDRMVAVNLTSVYLCTRALLPGMQERGWGRIVNIASQAGLAGHAYVSAYTAAKHGVVGFTRAVAAEVAGKGVTVNAVCPGYVDTGMTRRSVDNIATRTGRTEQEARDALAAMNPSGRFIRPEEVAALAVLLALPESGPINGQAIAL